jgi:small subunit ribosomal protein S9
MSDFPNSSGSRDRSEYHQGDARGRGEPRRRDDEGSDEGDGGTERAESPPQPAIQRPPPPPVVVLTPSRPYIWGLGRRKKAIARVRIKPGPGAFIVNGRPIDEFFLTLQVRTRAQAPLYATGTDGSYDVFCQVQGGGPTGQADAVRMGLARALKVSNPAFDDPLRANGLLTRDSRMKERKKYGRRGARRGFQFSKR